MAIGTTKSHTRIEKDRKWEDYQSLKRYWSYKGNEMREVIFDGSQTATGGLVEVGSGCGETIAFLSANDIVYASSEADLAALDGDSIWIDYIDSSGTLHEAIETKLDSVTSTATEVPIGCLSGTYVDAVASVAGDSLTMTNLNRTIANDLAGMYVVACGDATHQEGAYLTILSNTAASPTVITCTTTPNANWAADNVSIQKTLNNDVYRIRRMYSQTESIAITAQVISDKDKTNIYAVIADENTYGNAGSRYTALDTDYRCFLGRLQLEAVSRAVTDGEALGHQASVTFTPLSKTGQAAADITLLIDFQDKLDWQPCMELEPATDVIVQIKAILNDVAFYEVGVSFSCLEITV